MKYALHTQIQLRYTQRGQRQMATKVKRKTQKKSTRATSKTTRRKSTTPETIKKKEDQQLIRKILKYENNFTDGLKLAHQEGGLFNSILLYVALYPQLTNHINIHDYKKFYLALQNDDDFRNRVYTNEQPYSYMGDEVFHYQLIPLLHQRLLEVIRDLVVSGSTRKFYNSLHQIVGEVKGGISL